MHGHRPAQHAPAPAGRAAAFRTTGRARPPARAQASREKLAGCLSRSPAPLDDAQLRCRARLLCPPGRGSAVGRTLPAQRNAARTTITPPRAATAPGGDQNKSRSWILLLGSRFWSARGHAPTRMRRRDDGKDARGVTTGYRPASGGAAPAGHLPSTARSSCWSD
jgi:hypothetical protein